MSEQVRYTVNCSILFTELPLLERPAAARRAGFDAVEFWWPFSEPLPHTREIEQFVDAVGGAGTTLTGLNLYAGDLAAGERGTISTPGLSELVRANAELCIEIGQRLGCRSFNALYGNRRADVRPEHQDECATENLGMVAAIAARIGATILVEPLSVPLDYPLRVAADVLDVLNRVEEQTGADNLRLLADLYHLAANGDDLEEVLTTHADRIGHVQIADHPGRHEPGTGSLPIAELLTLLMSNGYRGRVGLEYTPTTSSADSFGWLSPPILPTWASDRVEQ